jgi:pimeloyl-ACP methyl ester carboxylesterase
MAARRRPSSRMRVAVVAATVIVSIGGVTTPSAARPARPPVPVLEWTACGEDFPFAECAVAAVPLDYDRPDRGTTQVALARVPAADTANRIGSVFVNPGGPGGSGVGMVLDGFGEVLAAQLQGRFDVVGFDPRGVGASDPLHCFESVEALNDHFAGQPVFPYLEDQFRPFFDTYRALGQECRHDRQAVVANMNTADVVRDLDLLRRAVGDAGLTYLGFSYGSYIGNTYANLFPGHIRALVIDGVLDPRLWSSGRQVESDRVATQQEFEEFLRLCDEAGQECAFSAPEGSAARWDALAAALLADPLEFPDGFVYTYDFLIADAAGAMYAPEVWGGPEGAAALFDLLADAILGDQGAAAAAAAVRRR